MSERVDQGFGAWVRKWGIWIILGVAFISVLVFVLTAGNKTKGVTIHYTNGVTELEAEGTLYTLFNDVTSETYVGSMVSDYLKVERGAKYGTVSSYGIMTLAVLYKVKGDESGELLVDTRDRLYVKKGTEEKWKQKTSEENLVDYRFASGSKTYTSLKDADDDKCSAALDLLRRYESGETVGTDQVVKIDDPLISENESIRREVFVFTADGLVYKAAFELFQYQNHIFLTVGYESNGNDGANVQYGLRISGELEEYFQQFWK